MDEKELLLLAAKAAKYDLHFSPDGMPFLKNIPKYWMKYHDNNPLGKWNPLGNDADAFRLAIRLNLHIKIYKKKTIVEVPEINHKTTVFSGIFREKNIRLAIVCAAAKIGELKNDNQ